MALARTTRAVTVAAALAVAAPSTPAHAALTVCNQTLDIANLALAVSGDTSGEAAGDGVEGRSQGWWVVAPNRCAEIVPDDLGEETYHLLAVDVRGGLLVTGEVAFCTAPRSFEIEGRGNCWLRGHTKGNFVAVETGGARDWTVFLREND